MASHPNIKKMKLIAKVILIFLISNISFASSYLSPIDSSFRLKIERLIQCGLKINPIHFNTYPKDRILKQIVIQQQEFNNSNCKNLANSVLAEIEHDYQNSSNSLSYSSNIGNYNFQDSNQTSYDKSTVSLSHLSKRNDKFDYELSIQHNDNETTFDQTKFNYLINNQRLTIGELSRNWSSSYETSLILSPHSRTRPGITLSNNYEYDFNIPFTNNNLTFDYEVFVEKLESNRAIPNAKLIGGRLNLYPNDRLNIALLRTAMWGGDGQSEDLNSFLKLLKGRDKSGGDDSVNQLAGIDLSYKFLDNKNLDLYTQIIGEDQDSFLPTKRFYQLGLGYSFLNNNPNKLSIEYMDTGSHGETSGNSTNVTYNHGIYQTGYRYHNDPIGANIDGDASKITLNYYTLLNKDDFLNLSISKTDLNKNSDNRKKYNNRESLHSLNLNYQKQINSNLKLNVINQFNSIKNNQDQINLAINLNYAF